MTKVNFELGEFRNLQDEKPLTKNEIERAKAASKKMYSHLDYDIEIQKMEQVLKTCKPKERQSYTSLLNLLKSQKAAGFGKKAYNN